MRVISGTAKGRRLKTPEGLDTRPTSELCKEAVFSIIQFELEGSRVLDLFAGSGQMGIEALSRGAKSCVFVDNAKASRYLIMENLKATGFSERSKVVMADAYAYLQNASGPIDIAFLDPPYGKAYIEKLLAPLSGVMSENGIIICESHKKDVLPENSGNFIKHKEYHYGKAKVTVYRSERNGHNNV